MDLTPQKGMVVDLTSVYRIDVISSDNTVAMNAEICLTEEGTKDTSIQDHTCRYWNAYNTCKNCLDLAFNQLSSNFDQFHFQRSRSNHSSQPTLLSA